MARHREMLCGELSGEERRAVGPVRERFASTPLGRGSGAITRGHVKKSLKYAAATALFALLGQAGLAAGFAPVASAASNPTTTITGVTGVRDVVVDSVAHRAYAATPNGVQVINTQTNAKLSVINTGYRAYDLALDRGSNSLYTTTAQFNRVVRIDLTTYAVDSRVVDTGAFTSGIAIDAGANRAYVTGPQQVSVIDTSSMTLVQKVTGAPFTASTILAKIAVDPAQHQAYITNTGTDYQRFRMNTQTYAVTATTVGNYTYGVTVDRVRHLAYVTTAFNNSVLVIDTATNTQVSRILAGTARAFGTYLDQSSRQLYVTSLDSNEVVILDLANQSIVERFALGANKEPVGIGVDTSSRTGFTANGKDNSVSVINPQALAPLPQSVSFTTAPPTTANVGSTADVAASGTASGNPVTFSVDSSSASGACTIADHGDGTATVSYTGGGTCTIDADQAAGNGYDAAATQQRSTTVSKKSQVITFTSTAPDDAKVGDTYAATATADSGGTVTFSSGATGVCSVQGSTVTFTHSGTCVINADQAGNAAYDAAPTAQQAVAVGPRAQAITFTSTPPGDAEVGDTYTVTATGGDSGKPVTFSTDGEICTVSDASTTDGVSSAKVTFTHAGVCFVNADQAGDDDHAAAGQVTQEIPVAKAPQKVTLTSDAPTNAKVGQTYDATATGGASGKPVTFTSTTTNVCTVADHGDSTATVTLVAGGDCTVQADQDGNADYSAAPSVSQTFAVAKKAQTVTITSTPPSPARVGDAYPVTATGGGSGNDVVFSVGSASDSGACTISGATVSFTGVGSCVIRANQAGNASYEPGSDQQSVTVTKKAVVPPAAAYEVSGTVAMRGQPGTLVVDSAARRAYVLNGSSNTVDVVDTATDQYVRSHPVGSRPYGIALDAAADRLYVTNNGSNSLSVLVASTGQLVTTVTGISSPDGVAVDPGAGRVFVTNGNNQLVVIRTSDNTVVGRTNVGAEVTAVAIDTVLHRAYTTNASGNSSSVVDTRTGSLIATVPVGARPVRVAVDSDAHRAYVSNVNAGTVSVIDTSTNQSLGTITVGSFPFALAVDETTHVVYVPNYTAQTVSVIDGNQGVGTVIDTVGGMHGPAAIAVDTTTHAAYVGNMTSPYTLEKITPVTTKRPQTITFTSTAPTDAKVGDTYAARANGGASGNPVTFMSGSPTVCTVTSTGTVQLVGAGTCSVQANQAGNNRYADADQVTQTFAVTKKAQTVTITSTPRSPAYVDDTYEVSATGGASGNDVVFSMGAASDSGACTVSGATVTFTGVGQCVVVASQAGNDTYAAGSDQQSVTITQRAKQAQAITFTSTAPTDAKVGDTYAASATGGGSGNPVTFTSGSPSVCTVSASGSVELVGAGTCEVQADQAGNPRYTAADQVTQTFAVTKKAQTVTITSTPPSPAYVGGTYPVTATGGASGNDVVFSVGAASDNGACTISGATVSFTGAGKCVVVASQAGNASYEAGSDQQTVTVTQTTTVTGIQQSLEITSKPPAKLGKTYLIKAKGGASTSPVVFSVDSQSAPGACTVGTAVAKGGAYQATVTLNGTGSCVIDADQAGQGRYERAPQVRQLVRGTKAAQRVQFAPVNTQARFYYDTTYEVSATGGGSGNPVTFFSNTTGVCEIQSQSGSGASRSAVVHFVGVGNCEVVGEQQGNASYDIAPPVSVNFNASAALQAITFTSTLPNMPKPNTTYQVTAKGGGSGNPVTFFIADQYKANCTFVDTNGNPVATSESSMVASPGTVKFLAAGAGKQCAINARQAGTADGRYNSAPFERQLIRIGKN